MALVNDICKAFCEAIEVSSFDGGIAVSTPYLDRSGDKISLYALGPSGGTYRLVDNALTVSKLESEGFDLESQGRRAALIGLLNEYGAIYDEEFGELLIEDVPEAELPEKVILFSAMLLRLNDLLLLKKERVESTFKEDIKSRLKDRIGQSVRYVEDEPISENLTEIIPDMVFYPHQRMPVALFIVTTDARLWQAINLQLIAEYERKVPIAVVAMLPTDGAVSSKARAQADNRLDAIPRYQSDPAGAISRVVSEIIGRDHAIH